MQLDIENQSPFFSRKGKAKFRTQQANRLYNKGTKGEKGAAFCRPREGDSPPDLPRQPPR